MERSRVRSLLVNVVQLLLSIDDVDGGNNDCGTMMTGQMRKRFIVAFLLHLNDAFLFRIMTTQSFTPRIDGRSPSAWWSNLSHQPLTTLLSIKNTGALELIDDESQSISYHDSNDMKTKSPFIAIVTEPDACDSDERYEATMNALYRAISSNYVNLISIRLSRNTTSTSNHSIVMDDTNDSQHDSDEVQFQSRYRRMIQQLCEWSNDDDESHHESSSSYRQSRKKFHVVVSSGPYMELGLRHHADGVHFKEMHQSQIPTMRQFYRTLLQEDNTIASSSMSTTENKISTGNLTRWRTNKELLVGTSVHSISSAIDAFVLYQPDYMFVGTCFTTQSHPDKIDLEGPRLPSQVCDSLNRYITSEQQSSHPRPLILGIGGIDETNCGTVVKPDQNSNSTSTKTNTCDGIAVIRSVLQSIDPAQTVTSMYHCMRNILNSIVES